MLPGLPHCTSIFRSPKLHAVHADAFLDSAASEMYAEPSLAWACMGGALGPLVCLSCRSCRHLSAEYADEMGTSQFTYLAPNLFSSPTLKEVYVSCPHPPRCASVLMPISPDDDACHALATRVAIAPLPASLKGFSELSFLTA